MILVSNNVLIRASDCARNLKERSDVEVIINEGQASVERQIAAFNEGYRLGVRAAEQIFNN